MSKRLNAGSTQKFTEIKNITDNIVVFNKNTACLIIEVQASNFALLSQQEQNTKIYSYAALLNSLSFSIQIIIRNKKIDITSYLNFLDQESQKLASIESVQSSGNETKQALVGEGLAAYIKLYKNFIQELITVNSVLDKKFYIVIPYSYLEKGVTGAASTVKKEAGQSDFEIAAKATLHTKADSLLSQIARLSLRAKVLQEDELIKLFYDIYNQSQTAPNEMGKGMKTIIVTGQEQ